MAQYNGCPDSDGDGIIDNEDFCAYVAGVKELKGCPDKDGDSIADNEDKCPELPGKKELAGCPDRDGDEVADYQDACPDLKGLIHFYGCPDTDKDGIPDYRDNCPEVIGDAANKGCPVVVAKVTAVILLKKVTFAPGSSEMLPIFGNIISLDDVIALMKVNPGAAVSVTGFAAEDEKNDVALSGQRADYVIDYIKKKGINTTKIKKAYLGKKNPVADNKTSKGRDLNRRVEIKITK
jgi:outer membrane protein OmpA-like peptidoglycan-associated protein